MSSWTIKTGNAALDGNNVYTGTNTFQSAVLLTGPAINQKRTTVSASAAYALNPSNGHYFDVVLVDNCTITAAATLTSTQEQEIFIKLTQDGAGAHSLTWSGVTWDSGAAPTMPQAAGATLSVTLVFTSSEIRGFSALTSADSITLTNIISTGILSTAAIKKTVRVVTVSGAVTVTALDNVVVINKAFAEATTVSLPAGSQGQEFIIKDGSGTAGTTNTITVSAGAIDSSATALISNNWGSLSLIYNGSKFNVI